MRKRRGRKNRGEKKPIVEATRRITLVVLIVMVLSVRNVHPNELEMPKANLHNGLLTERQDHIFPMKMSG